VTRYELLKFIHVLFAVVWVGGGLLALLFSIRTQRASREHRLGFARDMTFAADRVFAPAAMTTLLFGILMVLDASALSFGDTWILIGFGGIALSIAIGVGMLTPLSKKLVGELEGGGEGTAPLARIIQLSYLDNLILLVVVWAMITKPGA
jgi:uncharacterized membrane protein